MEQELKRKTTVIGHRNPDTDSICSAICYANLKRAITGDAYVPRFMQAVALEIMIIRFAIFISSTRIWDM